MPLSKEPIVDYSNVSLDDLIKKDKEERKKSPRTNFYSKRFESQNRHGSEEVRNEYGNSKYQSRFDRQPYQGTKDQRGYHHEGFRNRNQFQNGKRPYDRPKYSDREEKSKSGNPYRNEYEKTRDTKYKDFDRNARSSHERTSVSSKSSSSSMESSFERKEGRKNRKENQKIDSSYLSCRQKVERTFVKVDGLPEDFTNDDLRTLFEKIGELCYCKIKYDLLGRSLRRAKVGFRKDLLVDKAIRRLNGKRLEDCVLLVSKYAKS